MSFQLPSWLRVRPPLLLAMASLLAELVILVDGGGGPLIAHVALVCIATLIACYLAVTEKERIGGAAIWAYAAFFALFITSYATSLTPTYGLSELLMFSAGGTLFCAAVSTTNARREYLWQWYGGGLAALGLLEAVYGAWGYVGSSVQRLSGTFFDVTSARTSFANNLADFLLLAIPLLGVFVWRAKRVRTRVPSIAAMALAIAAFVLTFSRAAWVSAGIALLITIGWLLVFQRRELLRQAWKFVAVGLLSVVLITAFQEGKALHFETTPLLQKATFTADEGGASASERWQYWQAALTIAQEHPLLGSGIQSFGFLFPAHQKEFGIVEDHPHNVLLKIMVENGIPAALLFLTFLCLVGWRAVRGALRNPLHPTLPFLLGSLAALAHNILDYNFNAANFPLMMIGLGLAYGMSPVPHPPRKASPPRRGWVIIAGGMLAVSGLMLHEVWYNVPFKLGREALAEHRYEQAEALLVNAERLVFERDLSHVLGKLYRDRGAPGDREKELALINQSLLRSPLDAALIARRGEIEEATGEITAAKASFDRALQLDPMNRLRYYFLALRVAPEVNALVDPELVKRTKALLSAYLPLLQSNRHYTVTTDNPIYAIRLGLLLGQESLVAKLRAAYDRELAKFQHKTKLAVDAAPY